MECKKETNRTGCNCSYPGCERHGACCDCVFYHRGRGELPACFFTDAVEREYNRSIGRFVKENS